MQRKELKKAIKNFSNRTNFYELGLVRKLLKHRKKEELLFRSRIPNIVCPSCGSSRICIDDDGSEYSSEEFLTCHDCWDSFDDEVGYIDACKEYDCLCWGYIIDVELHFEKPDVNTYKWKEQCKMLILKELAETKRHL